VRGLREVPSLAAITFHKFGNRYSMDHRRISAAIEASSVIEALTLQEGWAVSIDVNARIRILLYSEYKLIYQMPMFVLGAIVSIFICIRK
jgi:hypothetical protein